MSKVTGKSILPALDEERCFSCHQLLGEYHRSDCVLLRRTARVKAVIEYEISVPAHWTKDDVEFHRNDSSWCADNLLDERREISPDCLCDYTSFTCEHIKDDKYLDEDGHE